jgi:hypothetical protein
MYTDLSIFFIKIDVHNVELQAVSELVNFYRSDSQQG